MWVCWSLKEGAVISFIRSDCLSPTFNKRYRGWYVVVNIGCLLCNFCHLAFVFVFPVTKKNFDLQVNSLGRGYLLLTLWHQNLMISVQKGNKLIVMQSFRFPYQSQKIILAQNPWKYNHRPMTSQSRHLIISECSVFTCDVIIGK